MAERLREVAGRRNANAALLLCGGGILGASYEIGCLAALDRVLGGGFSTSAFDLYLAVSAGSIVAALLANGLDPTALRRAILEGESSAFGFRRSDVYGVDVRGLAVSLWEAL